MRVQLGNFRFELDYEPGSPGCRQTPNGDGWPPEPAEITVHQAWHMDGAINGKPTWQALDKELALDLSELVHDELLKETEETLSERSEQDE